MKIILQENLKGIGRKGEIKNVKPGFFRNYLFPRKKAFAATPARMKQTEKLREALILEKQEVERKAQEISEKLQGMTLVLEKKASAKGKLFGSVHEKDIEKILAEQAKIEVAKEQIEIKEPIKTIGEHKVTVHLSPEVSKSISISVKPIAK